MDPQPELEPSQPARPITPLEGRIVALIEVLLCSDYPTQFLIGVALHVAGISPQTSDGQLRLAYITTLSLLDSVVLVGLILVFLRASGDSVRQVFFGRRPLIPEFRLGVMLALASLVIAMTVLVLIDVTMPGLHTVEHNPLQQLLASPRSALMFSFVVVVAGGIREEIQRAFVLHRFEQWLGGGTVGLIVGSLAFGSGHLVQGLDAVITTALLGAFWGLIYLRRRSIVAPMVSHAGFDLLQVVQFLFIGR